MTTTTRHTTTNFGTTNDVITTTPHTTTIESTTTNFGTTNDVITTTTTTQSTTTPENITTTTLGTTTTEEVIDFSKFIKKDLPDNFKVGEVIDLSEYFDLDNVKIESINNELIRFLDNTHIMLIGIGIGTLKMVYNDKNHLISVFIVNNSLYDMNNQINIYVQEDGSIVFDIIKRNKTLFDNFVKFIKKLFFIKSKSSYFIVNPNKNNIETFNRILNLMKNFK